MSDQMRVIQFTELIKFNTNQRRFGVIKYIGQSDENNEEWLSTLRSQLESVEK